MFLVLSVAIVPAGPESWLNRASVPSQAGHPGLVASHQAAGRRDPTLPVPTAHVGVLGEGGSQTSTHLCSLE